MKLPCRALMPLVSPSTCPDSVHQTGRERGEGVEGGGPAQAGRRGRCPGGGQARQGHPREGHQGVCTAAPFVGCGCFPLLCCLFLPAVACCRHPLKKSGLGVVYCSAPSVHDTQDWQQGRFFFYRSGQTCTLFRVFCFGWRLCLMMAITIL